VFFVWIWREWRFLTVCNFTGFHMSTTNITEIAKVENVLTLHEIILSYDPQ
jgi:hypothetical protein